MPDQPTQTYYATSVFTDPITLLSLGLLALQAEQVIRIIPSGAMPYVEAAIAIGTIILRFQQAVRPVALIAPQSVKPVEVRQLTMTQQGSEKR